METLSLPDRSLNSNPHRKVCLCSRFVCLVVRNTYALKRREKNPLLEAIRDYAKVEVLDMKSVLLVQDRRDAEKTKSSHISCSSPRRQTLPTCVSVCVAAVSFISAFGSCSILNSSTETHNYYVYVHFLFHVFTSHLLWQCKRLFPRKPIRIELIHTAVRELTCKIILKPYKALKK